MSNTKTKTTLTTAHGRPNKVGLYTTLKMDSKYVSKYSYTMVRLKASLLCCTHLHYHRQKLPKTEWSFEFQDTSLSRRQLAMEGKTLSKEGFKGRTNISYIYIATALSVNCVSSALMHNATVIFSLWSKSESESDWHVVLLCRHCMHWSIVARDQLMKKSRGQASTYYSL